MFEFLPFSFIYQCVLVLVMGLVLWWWCYFVVGGGGDIGSDTCGEGFGGHKYSTE